MYPRLRPSLIGAAVALSLAAIPALAQYEDAPKSKKPVAPAGPAPHTPDGKPDLSGVWNIPYVPDMSKGIEPLPFTAWGAENFKQYDPAKFDYTAHCLPAGLTRQMNTPMPLEINPPTIDISQAGDSPAWVVAVFVFQQSEDF